MILQGKYHPIDFKLLKKRLCAYTGAERGIHSPILLARTFYARCDHCDVNCQTPCLADLSWNIKYFHNIKLAAEILQGANISIYITDVLEYNVTVLFCDQPTFNRSGADGRCRVYQPLHKHKLENCVLERDRFGGVCVTIWAASNYYFLSKLVIMSLFDTKIAVFHRSLLSVFK